MSDTSDFRLGRFTLAQPDQLRSRYIRIGFTPGTVGIEAGARKVSLPKAQLPNAVGITVGAPSKRFRPVGSCIYCGASELRPGSGRPLSDEHIIPEGVGGTLILPEASCAACATVTGGTEGKILRTLLFAPRARLGIRGKKRDRPKTYPATTVVNGKDVTIELPIDVHPTVLFMVGLQRPRFLEDGKKRPSDVAGFWWHTMGTPDAALKGGAESVATPSFDSVRFCQFIAKIAHSYAVAAVGLSSIRPMLPPFILRRVEKAEQYPDCYELVGGFSELCAPADDLHTIGHQIFPFKGGRYLAVGVRLFANLGAPIYSAIVGEMVA